MLRSGDLFANGKALGQYSAEVYKEVSEVANSTTNTYCSLLEATNNEHNRRNPDYPSKAGSMFSLANDRA